MPPDPPGYVLFFSLAIPDSEARDLQHCVAKGLKKLNVVWQV